MSSGLATFFRPDGTTAGYGIYYGNADLLFAHEGRPSFPVR